MVQRFDSSSNISYNDSYKDNVQTMGYLRNGFLIKALSSPHLAEFICKRQQNSFVSVSINECGMYVQLIASALMSVACMYSS